MRVGLRAQPESVRLSGPLHARRVRLGQAAGVRCRAQHPVAVKLAPPAILPSSSLSNAPRANRALVRARPASALRPSCAYVQQHVDYVAISLQCSNPAYLLRQARAVQFGHSPPRAWSHNGHCMYWDLREPSRPCGKTSQGLRHLLKVSRAVDFFMSGDHL